MALKSLAARRGVSMAELIRVSLDRLIEREAGVGGEAMRERAKAAAGKFDSRLTDVSVAHDRYLAEAISER